MNVPENGKVVVIDDNYEEAIPLLKVLAKSKIPSMYFSGLAEELPANRLENIRLVFLDLKLVSVTDEKTVISAISSVLKKIISEQNGPYILILWSIHDTDYRKKLEDSFQNQLSDIKPIMILTLKKTDYIQRDDGEKINFVGNALELIENKLIRELKKAGIFHLFVIWENLVHKSAGKIVNDFSSFYPLDDNWNNNMCGIFQKLAGAYAGKQLKDGENDKLIKDALLTFNGTFLDTLENEMRDFEIEKTEITKSLDVKNDVLAEINTRLLLAKDNMTGKPGTMYYEDDENLLKKLIYDFFDPFKVIEYFAEQNELKIEDICENNKKLKKEYKSKYEECFKALRENIKKTSKLVKCEVSPYCDYAQDKWKLHRMLIGLMWPENYSEKIKKADYVYTSPTFKIDSEIYKIVFDLRYLTALPFEDLKDKQPVFRIRHELLVDIQSKIAGHINRPGVISLE